MGIRVRNGRQRRKLLSTLAVMMTAAGIGLAATLTGSAGAATTSVVIDTGGSVLSHRAAGRTGSLAVTFGFDTTTLAGGPYENQGSQTYNFPLYEAARGTTPQFWDNYVEELVSVGVDFVAVDTRGYILGSAVPNQGGDPRALAGLVDAINRGGYATS
jgi:hypothetical protein